MALTAIEYIENNLIKVEEGWQYLVLGGEEYINTKHIKTLFEQAKQMEKEQIQRAFSDGQEIPINHPTLPHYSREEYYNETYNK